jgi:hypothetical protein
MQINFISIIITVNDAERIIINILVYFLICSILFRRLVLLYNCPVLFPVVPWMFWILSCMINFTKKIVNRDILEYKHSQLQVHSYEKII